MYRNVRLSKNGCIHVCAKVSNHCWYGAQPLLQTQSDTNSRLAIGGVCLSKNSNVDWHCCLLFWHAPENLRVRDRNRRRRRSMTLSEMWARIWGHYHFVIISFPCRLNTMMIGGKYFGALKLYSFNCSFSKLLFNQTFKLCYNVTSYD